MYFPGAAVIQEFCSLPHLCSADDGIVDQQQAAVLNQIMHRNQLHLGDQVPLFLNGGHEGPGPGRRIFNERTGKRYARFIGVADGVSRSGVRYAGHSIRMSVVPFGQHPAAVIPHLLHA